MALIISNYNRKYCDILYVSITIIAVFMFAISVSILSESFISEGTINISSGIHEAKALATESIRPSINIINPQYGATIPMLPPNATVIVSGSAIDSESGIQKVEAFVDTFPFGDAFPYREARPVAPGNWSEWSIPLNLTTGYNRILAKAIDNVGNENWDEKILILGQGATDSAVSRLGSNYTLVTIVVPNNVSSGIQEIKALATESIRPSINIINPQYGATIPMLPPNATVIVSGSAIDSESGIQKVEAFVDTFPFGDAFPYREARPVAPGNWSEWSIPLNLTTGYNRILAKAIDNVGNENWDEKILILGQGSTATMEPSEQKK